MNGQVLARITAAELTWDAPPVPKHARGRYGARAVKRLVDVVAALLLLVLSAPLCALVAIAIKLEDGGAVLFRQTRVGRRGQLFTLRKLRSMCPDAEAESGPQCAVLNDPRVTRVGSWIRALRIDEIPQAWNVLIGEMSFVGPRPERPEFVARLRETVPHYDYRHQVRPGITGWAQVNQPYSASVAQPGVKQQYDLYYLQHVSARLDVLILLRTIKIILLGWGSR
ncbi:MAG: sugar transferase [Deltaproteobacteria bacterium]|nr:sugar transferase [Deltaproteobacteria bacterium]